MDPPMEPPGQEPEPIELARSWMHKQRKPGVQSPRLDTARQVMSLLVCQLEAQSDHSDLKRDNRRLEAVMVECSRLLSIAGVPVMQSDGKGGAYSMTFTDRVRLLCDHKADVEGLVGGLTPEMKALSAISHLISDGDEMDATVFEVTLGCERLVKDVEARLKGGGPDWEARYYAVTNYVSSKYCEDFSFEWVDEQAKAGGAS